MLTIQRKGIKLGLGFCVCMLLLGACKHQTQESRLFSNWAKAPKQSLYDAQIMFTDSGALQMILKSSTVYNYDDEKQTQIFPKGVKAKFYGENKSLDALMLADSAINFRSDKLMRFYGNVVIYDYRKGDTVYTEALYWNQKNRTIHSDVAVKQVNRSMVLVGDGFDSDDRMNNLVLRNPRGVIY
ncbi:MAG: LPS export ABC transporter periplasmic protein LptC [Bacteroidales bacterium]